MTKNCGNSTTQMWLLFRAILIVCCVEMLNILSSGFGNFFE